MQCQEEKWKDRLVEIESNNNLKHLEQKKLNLQFTFIRQFAHVIRQYQTCCDSGAIFQAIVDLKSYLWS